MSDKRYFEKNYVKSDLAQMLVSSREAKKELEATNAGLTKKNEEQAEEIKRLKGDVTRSERHAATLQGYKQRVQESERPKPVTGTVRVEGDYNGRKVIVTSSVPAGASPDEIAHHFGEKPWNENGPTPFRHR